MGAGGRDAGSEVKEIYESTIQRGGDSYLQPTESVAQESYVGYDSQGVFWALLELYGHLSSDHTPQDTNAQDFWRNEDQGKNRH